MTKDTAPSDRPDTAISADRLKALLQAEANVATRREAKRISQAKWRAKRKAEAQ